MSAPVILRTMMLDDVEAALEIERASSGVPWTSGIFRDELSEPDSRYYTVAVSDGRVIGFVGLMTVVDEGHITNIAVSPSLRRARLGTTLLLHAARLAIARRCHSLTLEVRVSNEPARALYARFGFAPAGIRKAYYADNREDALVLWVHDIDTAAYGLKLASIAERVERISAGSGELS